MSSPLQEQLEQTLEEYRRKRADLRGMQRRMADISVSVTAPRNIVSVTVGQHGEVTEVRFPSGAYRNLAPAELGSVVLETVGKAQLKVREQLAELMAPMMPPGIAIHDLLAGKADLDSLLPAEPPQSGLFLKRDDRD